jgi:hypothetical protein
VYGPSVRFQPSDVLLLLRDTVMRVDHVAICFGQIIHIYRHEIKLPFPSLFCGGKSATLGKNKRDRACSKKNGFTVSLWHALSHPKGTSREIVGKLNDAAAVAGMAEAAVQRRRL